LEARKQWDDKFKMLREDPSTEKSLSGKLSFKNKGELGMMAHARKKQENHEFNASPGKVIKNLSLKQKYKKQKEQTNKNINKRARGIAQVAYHLPSMCKALGSNPINTKS
jgi:hypothetical protein